MPVFTTSDGEAIVYDDVGKGRPIMLLHGWAARAGFFQPQVEGLSGNFRLVIPDLRGHGRSLSSRGLTIGQLSRDVADLADHLGLSRTLLVGWSMGAMIAWRLLGDGTRWVNAAVFVDMAPKILNDESWRLGLANGATVAGLLETAATMRKDWPGYARRIAKRLLAKGYDGETTLQIWSEAQFLANDGEAMAALWRSLAAEDQRASLPQIACPALVIHGARSQLYAQSTAEFLVQAMPEARRFCFEHSGHAPQLEQPRKFTDLLARFARVGTEATSEAQIADRHF